MPHCNLNCSEQNWTHDPLSEPHISALPSSSLNRRWLWPLVRRHSRIRTHGRGPVCAVRNTKERGEDPVQSRTTRLGASHSQTAQCPASHVSFQCPPHLVCLVCSLPGRAEDIARFEDVPPMDGRAFFPLKDFPRGWVPEQQDSLLLQEQGKGNPTWQTGV